MNQSNPNNNSISPQENFDQVVSHLRNQGCKSVSISKESGRGEYLYRGPDGKKCAAGCLIQDDEYDPSMEGTEFNELMAYNIKCPKSLYDRLFPHYELILELQIAHDNGRVEEWEDRFQQIARIFNLKYSPPEGQ